MGLHAFVKEGTLETVQLADLSERIKVCRLCDRLVAHRESVGKTRPGRFKDWSRPVPGFGDPRASVMIVGLAPGANGANRTGRVFTGDPSANFLMSALCEAGLANQPTSDHQGDGLRLCGAYMTNAVRCVPPPNGPRRDEKDKCRPYLIAEMKALPNLKAVVALGHIAFEACLKAYEELSGEQVKDRFEHGKRYPLGERLPVLIASYHPSPFNTNTKRLSQEQLVEVFCNAKAIDQ